MKPRMLFVVAVLFIFALPAKADLIPPEPQIATFITVESTLPLAPGVANQLATNLLTAQQEYSYTSFEPDSLSLSVAAVLRAISLEMWPGGPTEITTQAATPLPFWQSILAIDDRASLSFSVDGQIIKPGDVIDFGSVPVGSTSKDFKLVSVPEPGSAPLLIVGIALLSLFIVKRRVTAQ